MHSTSRDGPWKKLSQKPTMFGWDSFASSVASLLAFRRSCVAGGGVVDRLGLQETILTKNKNAYDIRRSRKQKILKKIGEFCVRVPGTEMLPVSSAVHGLS